MIRQNQRKVMAYGKRIDSPALRRSQGRAADKIPGCRRTEALGIFNLPCLFPSSRKLEIQIHAVNICLPSLRERNRRIIGRYVFCLPVIASFIQYPVHQIHAIRVYQRHQVKRKAIVQPGSTYPANLASPGKSLCIIFCKFQQNRRGNPLICMKRSIVKYLFCALANPQHRHPVPGYAAACRLLVQKRIAHKQPFQNPVCQKRCIHNLPGYERKIKWHKQNRAWLQVHRVHGRICIRNQPHGGMQPLRNQPECIVLLHAVWKVAFQVRHQQVPLQLSDLAGMPRPQKILQAGTGLFPKAAVNPDRISRPCQRQLHILYKRSFVSRM